MGVTLLNFKSLIQLFSFAFCLEFQQIDKVQKPVEIFEFSKLHLFSI